MANFVILSLGHNLKRSLCLKNKLIENLISKQQVRNLPRWAHRRPLKVFYDQTSAESDSNYAEKLRIERGNIMNTGAGIPSDQGNLYSKEQPKQELNNIQSPVDNDFPARSGNINRDFPTEECDSKFKKHSSHHERHETHIDTTRTTKQQEENIPRKTKKERKLEHKIERKINKLKESARKDGVPLYTKLEDNDTKLSKLMLIAKSRNKKVKKTHIVLEGKRLIKDAIKAGYMPEQIFFSRIEDAADLHLPDGTDIQLYKMPYRNIQMWSDVTTSPGILGFLKTPSLDKKVPGRDAIPLTVICDNVRDPGNLGSILRCAAGVGCERVILTKGCVDLWDPKVLRTGAGAHFRTAVIIDMEWEDLETYVDMDNAIFLADNNSVSLASDSETLVTDQRVCEEDLEKEAYEKCLNSIPIIPYFAADYVNCGPIALIIGGETEGLSFNAFKVANERAGIRLNVPLSNGVESLNSGTAFGVIAFEMKRQFLKQAPKSSVEKSETTVEVEARGG